MMERRDSRQKWRDGRRKVVYVAHAYRSDPRANVAAVRRIARELALSGCVPLAPQLYLPAIVDEATERDVAMAICLQWVSMADEVRVYGEVSEGMQDEIDEARRLGIAVINQEVAAWK